MEAMEAVIEAKSLHSATAGPQCRAEESDFHGSQSRAEGIGEAWIGEGPFKECNTIDRFHQMVSKVVEPAKHQRKCTSSEYEQMVAYIEIPENFTVIMGAGAARKTKVGVDVMTKTKAFSVMAAKLGGFKGFPILKCIELRKRFERYVVQFKKALEFFKGTGAGLTESEIARGMTLEEKMNRQFPMFFRMNNIFGERANVSPPALRSIGLEKTHQSLC